MSKKMLSLAAIGLLAVAGAYASDAWKDKDFQNWDQKDVQKILSDSPWSKKFQYATATSGGPGRVAYSGPLNSGGGPSGSATAGGGTGSPGNPVDRGISGPGDPGQQINLTVTWYSAHAIREAIARKKELAGVAPDDARKNLSTEIATYQVAVSGTDLTAFGTIHEDDLKRLSYLMSKATKEKTAPGEIIVQRAQNDEPVAIIFEFPKTAASGAPTIAKNEKGVEFFTQAGKIPIKIQFDLSKMTDKLGSDY